MGRLCANNRPFTLPANHVFQKKMVGTRVTVPQVASNNGGDTQAAPPINGGTSPAHIVGLHHMGVAVRASKYAVQNNLYVNIIIMLFLILNFLCLFLTYRRPVI